MMLSDEKVTHMSHVILQELLEKDIVDITEDESVVRRAIKRAIQMQMHIGEEMDAAVRRKIASLSRHVPEGSPEWETLYQKYFREEQVRHGLPVE
ncbi:MAG: DUF507 family protein [Nitrospirota bacterium]|jgi:hypothetical protein